MNYLSRKEKGHEFWTKKAKFYRRQALFLKLTNQLADQKRKKVRVLDLKKEKQD